MILDFYLYSYTIVLTRGRGHGLGIRMTSGLPKLVVPLVLLR